MAVVEMAVLFVVAAVVVAVTAVVRYYNMEHCGASTAIILIPFLFRFDSIYLRENLVKRLIR